MTESTSGAGDPSPYDQLDSSGSRYDANPDSTGAASGYDADEAWTVRKGTPGPGWTTQAGSGNGPGWGSAPTYESDATPSGTGYGEGARYEADAVEAASSAPADPSAESEGPDYSDPIADAVGPDSASDSDADSDVGDDPGAGGGAAAPR